MNPALCLLIWFLFPSECDLATRHPLLDIAPESADAYRQQIFSSPNQGLAHPLALPSRPDDEREFQSKKVTNVLLSTLEETWENKDFRRALRTLSTPHAIKLDDAYQVEDPAFFLHPHNLDFLLVIPKRPGWDVLRPPNEENEGDFTWSFQLTLSQPHRRLQVKHGKLGFDPTGCVLFLGRDGNQNDVWLAMVEEAEWGEPEGAFPAEHVFHDATQMSQHHLRMVQSFFLYALSRQHGTIAGINVYEEDRYRINLSSGRPNWSFASNFE
jgi:hypothetical protein